MNAAAAAWRWWYQSSPLAINSPLPMKFFEPCCCIHDLPETELYLVNSSFISSVSVKQSRGSNPFQYINLSPIYIHMMKMNSWYYIDIGQINYIWIIYIDIYHIVWTREDNAAKGDIQYRVGSLKWYPASLTLRWESLSQRYCRGRSLV